jgi:hypothetical protein
VKDTELGASARASVHILGVLSGYQPAPCWCTRACSTHRTCTCAFVLSFCICSWVRMSLFTHGHRLQSTIVSVGMRMTPGQCATGGPSAPAPAAAAATGRAATQPQRWCADGRSGQL